MVSCEKLHILSGRLTLLSNIYFNPQDFFLHCSSKYNPAAANPIFPETQISSPTCAPFVLMEFVQ